MLICTLWHVGKELLAAGKGTTFPSISYADLAGKPLPLPPLAEQHRIVAKVDELMGLIDRLERHLGAREGTQDDFAIAWTRRVETTIYDSRVALNTNEFQGQSSPRQTAPLQNS